MVGNPVFVVGQDARSMVCRWLGGAGIPVESHTDVGEAVDHADHTSPAAVVVDAGTGSLQALVALKARHPTTPVIVLKDTPSIEGVVEAMQAGAHAFLPKPVDRSTLMDAVYKALGHRQEESSSIEGLLGHSPPMLALCAQLVRVAAAEVTVLIQGESGTGKELVARAIHQRGHRADGPFVALNCAAIPESLQESELFGHKKGAFTGAQADRVGRFEQAHGGTLFLDEVGELTPGLQAKLLRVLQERSFYPVGGTSERHVDVRIVAATHQDLGELVRQGRFRQDLFYRLAVFELGVPPLRERGDDVALLARSFLDELSARHRRSPLSLGMDTARVLQNYAWPGNVRELRNAMERAVVVATGHQVRPSDLPPRVLAPCKPQGSQAFAPPRPQPDQQGPVDTLSPMEHLERDAISRVLHACGGNVSEAIRELSIPRTSMYRKLKRYGLRGT